jgi:hypothetical protein
LVAATHAQELELIAGFLSRKPAAETSFFDEFRPHVHRWVSGHFPDRWQEYADLEQSAMLRVCELRETKEGRTRLTPPFSELAQFAAEAPARKLAREKKSVPLQDWDASQPPNQETAFEFRRLLAIAVTLPRGMAATMLAQAGFVTGEGPALHEALGIDERSARRRLARAQDAVIEIAEGGKAELEDD